MTDISYIDRWMDYPGDSIPEHRIVMSITRSDKFEDLVDITYYSVLGPIPTSSYTTHFFRFLPAKFGEYPPAPDERYWKDRDNQTPTLFDDLENEYLPEERWFGYPEFKLQAIANHYGMDLQAIKLAEEGAELAATTLKNVGLMIQQENGEGGESIAQKRAEAMEKTDEEIADVLLVSRQMEYLLLESPEYDEKITRLMNEKADRQLSRIKEEAK